MKITDRPDGELAVFPGSAVAKTAWGFFLLGLLLLPGRTRAETARITVDPRTPGHTISSMLFGDQIQWKNYGQDLLAVDSATPSSGTLRTDVLDMLKPMGLTLMRFPGGVLSDYFHWNVSTGPYAGRGSLMIDELLPGSTYQYSMQTPYFGANEFVDAARHLGAEMMITANVGTGTAAEAAAWLTYYKSRGVVPRYWEIGNEVYLPGNTPAGNYLVDHVHKTPLQYAAAFDAFASALRAVDSSVQVGMIGAHITVSWAPGLESWNQEVLQNVHQKVDFIAVHNAYAPQDNSNSEAPAVYAAMLATPSWVRSNLDLIEQDIASYAPAHSRNMAIAVTEHAALFTPSTTISSIDALVRSFQRSQSLAGALYSASLFNVFFRDPALQIATHINPLSSLFQAPLNVNLPNGEVVYDPSKPAHPIGYDPDPIPQAYFHMFRLYADAAGGALAPTGVTHSPTFDAPAMGNLTSSTTVPSLDAVSVLKTGSPSTLYVYVVNRDLTRAIPATVEMPSLSAPIQLRAVDQLKGPDYRSKNDYANPSAVQRIQVSAGGLPGGTYTFPAYSLTRFTFTIGAVESLSEVAIYPNPLRPARGDQSMHFDNLPAGSRVQIYTLAGEKVRDLNADDTGRALWDGKNGSGEMAASGVYFVLLEGAGSKKTVKVAIQR